MKYEGYIVTTAPFGDSNIPSSVVVYADKALAAAEGSNWFAPAYISKVSIDIDKPFINDEKDPFVDIGKFRSLLTADLYRQLAQSNPVELTETNEWERIQERHPGLTLMEVFNQFPEEFDKLPLWAEEAYTTTSVRLALQANHYDGAIHAVHGPREGVAYHTFQPARIVFIEDVTE
ncbi:hypothetical protein MLDJOKPK_00263 [Salmonella phage SPAsTU]|nr:hypothetical protein STsAS_153 [Salmonella phage STsAS]AWN09159.1 hypothetical protein MLDJOKPK_00263 [Salmonella phage SPAsTU]